MANIATPKQRLAAEAIKNYRKGDPITDEQLKVGIEECTKTINFLMLLGIEFRLGGYLPLIGFREEFEKFAEARKRG